MSNSGREPKEASVSGFDLRFNKEVRKMYCERCGTQLPDNARFCSRCGKKVSADAAPPPVRAAGRPSPKEEVRGGAAARAPKIPDPLAHYTDLLLAADR